MNICPVGAELYHGDGQTDEDPQTADVTKLTVTFRNFVNVPNEKQVRLPVSGCVHSMYVMPQEVTNNICRIK
jgi:hypothetical protein